MLSSCTVIYTVRALYCYTIVPDPRSVENLIRYRGQRPQSRLKLKLEIKSFNPLSIQKVGFAEGNLSLRPDSPYFGRSSSGNGSGASIGTQSNRWRIPGKDVGNFGLVTRVYLPRYAKGDIFYGDGACDEQK